MSCGKEGGFDFSKAMAYIVSIKEFDSDKNHLLVKRINELCEKHDTEYDKGGNILNKLDSDLDFSSSVAGLLSWTSAFNRAVVFFILFAGVIIQGNSAYNWK